MTDLAAQTALSTSGITRIVDRLERRGLLTPRQLDRLLATLHILRDAVRPEATAGTHLRSALQAGA